MRAKYAIIGLALAMACYLFYLMQHLHDPGTTETRLQGLLRAQAAEIVRLKQLLRKSQQQQRSKAAAVPLDAVPQTPPDLAPIVAAGQPPADGGAGASAAAAAATADSAEPEPPAMKLKDDPAYKVYFKMLSMGVPTGNIKLKMQMEGADPAMLDKDPESASPNAGAMVAAPDDGGAE